MIEMDDDELAAALGIDDLPPASSRYTPEEERIMAGFEDIVRFVQTRGRLPEHGENRDIFERLYAVRLDRLRHLPDALALLAPLDSLGLLSGSAPIHAPAATLNDDELLAELGYNTARATTAAPDSDITVLRHVRHSKERQAAETVAERQPCADFQQFEPLFIQAERELKAGIRQSRQFGRDSSFNVGNFFILGGLLVYVADKGEPLRTSNGEADARLRVIYSNGTESNLLMRSLQRALYKDEGSRMLTGTDMGPLFNQAPAPEPELITDTTPSETETGTETGTIYVLRSLSEHPYVAQHRDLIHKIGVTGGKVATRLASAAKDATYLLADVEVVATYTLHRLDRMKVEHLIHRVFSAAQLDLTIEDRFGHPVKPKEWFLVPLPLIDEAIQGIQDGTITHKVYDPHTACFVAATRALQ